MASLVDRLLAAELEFGHRTAVVDNDRRLSFAEIADRSNRAAQVLLDITGRGPANIAILVGNAAEAVELDIGAIKAGLGRISLNPRLTDDERIYILDNSTARVLVYGPEFSEFAAQVAESRDLVLLETGEEAPIGPGQRYEAALAQASSDLPEVTADPSAPSLIMYTSGTTGRPKGAVWTFASRTAGIVNMMLNELDHAASVGMVHAASVAHGSGSKIAPIYLRGGRSIMMRQFDPAAFFELVRAESATASFMVPTMVQNLVDEAKTTGTDMPSMVQITYGGAKMPRQTIESALELFGPVFAQVYGSCEAPHPILILPRHEHRIDSPLLAMAGHRATEATLRFGSPDTPATEGATGELLIGGDNVFGGYWNDQHATDEAFVAGYFRTGDIATLHDGGYVEIVGRAKEMIISGGFNVYPAEVERVLMEIPGVSGACVYGISDKQWGEAVVAAITVEPGQVIGVDEVMSACRTKLANYKVPKQVRVVDAFPLGTTGKIQRAEVARLHPEMIG